MAALVRQVQALECRAGGDGGAGRVVECQHQPGERAPNRLSAWVESVLQSLQTGYARALAAVMRHRRLTLFSLLLTVAFNVWLYAAVPKGFFPDQDTGMLMGQLQADQNISFAAIKPKLLQYSDILLRDPAVQSVMISTGSGGFGSRNSANLFVQLKEQNQRQDNAVFVHDDPFR